MPSSLRLELQIKRASGRAGAPDRLTRLVHLIQTSKQAVNIGILFLIGGYEKRQLGPF